MVCQLLYEHVEAPVLRFPPKVQQLLLLLERAQINTNHLARTSLEERELGAPRHNLSDTLEGQTYFGLAEDISAKQMKTATTVSISASLVCRHNVYSRVCVSAKQPTTSDVSVTRFAR